MKTKSQSKPAAKRSTNGAGEQQILEHIHQRAYELWEASGCLPGNDMAHWIQAEQEIRAQKQSRPRAS